jgi:selenocysteine lyase/cysteine desulfurase
MSAESREGIEFFPAFAYSVPFLRGQDRMTESPTPDPIEGIHARIRSRFPLIDRDANSRARTYLNSGAGSLMVDTAIEAAAHANRTLNPMPGTVSPGEIETGRFHERVRALAADFLHAGSGHEISFHVSSTAAIFNLSFAMRGAFGGRANLVVTDLDHMANISPWETVLGEGEGLEIRHARVTGDGRLDIDHLLTLIDSRTRVLAVTMASNALGTVPPLPQIVASARAKSPQCLVVVDAVHHALHGPIDVGTIGCDFLAFSGYKVFGPMLGVLWGREALLEKLRPYRVETNKNEPPWKFEQGMLNNAALASLEAALEYLLWVAREAAGPGRTFPGRPEAFTYAMSVIADYEQGLSRRVLEGFREFPPERFRPYGITDPGRTDERDPTFAFEIPGQAAFETKIKLWERRAVQIADGNHYSAAVTRHLGKSALCRASFAHYDNARTVGLFLDTLAEVVRSNPK